MKDNLICFLNYTYGGYMLKKILFLTIFLFSFNLLYAKDLNVGFVYVGPVGDGGWTYAHDLGRQQMAKLPFVKNTIY